jgi:hypothetical protein
MAGFLKDNLSEKITLKLVYITNPRRTKNTSHSGKNWVFEEKNEVPAIYIVLMRRRVYYLYSFI